MRISDWSSDVCSSDLEPFSVYVKPEGQPVREVIAIFNLEVPPDNVPKVNEKMFMLRDRYINELLKGPPIEVPARFTAKDLYSLRDRLQKPTEEVLGKGIVTQVLLLTIIYQIGRASGRERVCVAV